MTTILSKPERVEVNRQGNIPLSEPMMALYTSPYMCHTASIYLPIEAGWNILLSTNDAFKIKQVADNFFVWKMS